MQIAHEAPIVIFDLVQQLTSYDYCLVHLYDQNPKYKEKFLEAKKKGRKIILDNSTFELGSAYNQEKFIQAIWELEPWNYVIPGSSSGAGNSLTIVDKWLQLNLPKNSQPMAVLDGFNYSDIVWHYKHLVDYGVGRIGVPFDMKYFEHQNSHPNIWVNYMIGRVDLISELLYDGHIDESIPIHLLGMGNPLEVKFYNVDDFSFITSLDTSSPVIHGIYNKKYDHKIGTWYKEMVKVASIIDQPLSSNQISLIIDNICVFKDYINNERF